MVELIPNEIQQIRQKSPLIDNKFRQYSLDIYRGLGIVMVIYTHMFVGLWEHAVDLEANLDVYLTNPIILFLTVTGTGAPAFFLAGGCAFIYSMQIRLAEHRSPWNCLVLNLKRGLFLILLGDVVDYFVYGYSWGLVDTLQINGLCIIFLTLIYYLTLARHYKKQQPIAPNEHQANFRIFIIIGIVIVLISPLARIIIGYPICPTGADPLIMCNTPTNFLEIIQGWLTTSFFPIFPYFAYFCFGAGIGSRLLALRNSPLTKKKSFQNRLLIVAFLALVGVAILEVIASSVMGSRYYLNYQDWKWWEIELMFVYQPTSTSVFLLDLWLCLFVWVLVMRVFDFPRSPQIQKFYTFISKYGGSVLKNFLHRFGQYSLTIYVLQYIWLMILRALEYFQIGAYLYQLSLLQTIIWIVVAELIYGIIALLAERIEYRYGIEWILRKWQFWILFKRNKKGYNAE